MNRPSDLRRRYIVSAFLFLAILCSMPSGPVYGQEGDKLQANLEDVLLEDFIRFYGRYSGRNIIYRSDQIPKIKFNIYSHDSISEHELSAVFTEILNAAGLAAVSRGDGLYIFPKAQAKQIHSPFQSNPGEGPDDELVTTIYLLDETTSARDAAAVLKGMNSAVGRVYPIHQARALLMTDTRERVDDMVSILETLSTLQPDWEFDVIPLENAEAAKALRVINSMYSQLVKTKQIAQSPLLIAVEWSNSLFFAGSPTQKAQIRELLARLDKVNEQDTGIIRVYRLQSAKAESLASVLQSLVEAKVKQDQKEKPKTISTSDIFKVSADADTNSLVILGTKEVFVAVEKIIEELDKPRDQVFVEALVLETTLSTSQRFGVEWMAGGADDNNIGGIGFTESPSSLQSFASPVMEDEIPNFGALPGGFSLGVVGNLITFGDETFPTLSALVGFVKGASEINILSTPQIMTLDHAEAEIFVGENRPFQTGKQVTDGETNYSYDYREVGVKLKITPHINLQRRLVLMDVEQDVKKVAESSADYYAPVTLNRYTKTSIQIRDGSTIVISGLVRDDTDQSQTGVPGLAQIPILGWLFKRKNTSATKSTLMVFITARIVHTLEESRDLTADKEAEMESFHNKSKDLFENQFNILGPDDESMEFGWRARETEMKEKDSEEQYDETSQTYTSEKPAAETAAEKEKPEVDTSIPVIYDEINLDESDDGSATQAKDVPAEDSAEGKTDASDETETMTIPPPPIPAETGEAAESSEEIP